MAPTLIIDAHAHCGRQDRFPPQDLRDYVACLRGGGIGGAVMMSPVMEIYDRYDPDFRDTPQWRARRAESNEYLLGIGSPGFTRTFWMRIQSTRFDGRTVACGIETGPGFG